MTCSSCGAESQDGNFCAKCGAALRAACPSCGADAARGANYCTQCGAGIGAGIGAGVVADRAPWIIGGVSLIIVVALVLVFLPDGARRAQLPAGGADAPFAGSGAGDGTGVQGASGAPAAPGGVGLSADMRTNADRLFDRIMTAAEQGNEAEVARFMPMAIQAYGMVDDLDADGSYHLALLHLTAAANDQALDAAGRILGDHPDHLLGLAVAAQAAAAAGDGARAAGYWRRFLDAYAAEAGRPLPEYVDHRAMLPAYRARAREALGDG